MADDTPPFFVAARFLEPPDADGYARIEIQLPGGRCLSQRVPTVTDADTGTLRPAPADDPRWR